MPISITRIVPIGLDSQHYRRLQQLAERESVSVATILRLAAVTYMTVLTDEAICDQLHGLRGFRRPA